MTSIVFQEYNVLDSTPFVFDFIGCSETWLSPQCNLERFKIPGYSFVNDNRVFSSGGGVGLYIKSDHNFKLSNKQSNISKEYLNLLRSEGFNSLIFEATRVTESSQTCIDHIHTNLSLPSTSGSIAVEIADHLPVFSILYNLELTPFPDKLEFRDFKRFNNKLFKAALGQINWSPVFSTNDVNESLVRFTHIFNRVSNQYAPLKSTKVKNSIIKPWITSGLKKSMKVRDKLYKKWLTTRSLLFLNKYKLYRNKIVSINKLYRTLYYNKILADSTDTKKMWDNINFIINKRRPSSNIDKLQVDDKQYLQPTSISNVINNYFCNIPIHLASKLPKPNRHFASYLKQKREKQSKFRFMLVNEIEVFYYLIILMVKSRLV